MPFQDFWQFGEFTGGQNELFGDLAVNTFCYDDHGRTIDPNNLQ